MELRSKGSKRSNIKKVTKAHFTLGTIGPFAGSVQGPGERKQTELHTLLIFFNQHASVPSMDVAYVQIRTVCPLKSMENRCERILHPFISVQTELFAGG